MVNLIVDHPMSSVERGKNDRIVNDTKKGIIRTRDGYTIIIPFEHRV